MLAVTGVEAGAVMVVAVEGAAQLVAVQIPGTATAKIHAQLLVRNGVGLIVRAVVLFVQKINLGIAVIRQHVGE